MKTPVTVVTGFLGAGKTTLLSGLLKETRQRRLAILVNEFGAESVDGALFRGQGLGDDVEIHDIEGGLVAYGERFGPVMEALRGRRNEFDHVIIETSGLALPTAAMAALSEASLSEDFILDATLAVVDTPLLLAGRQDVEQADPAAASAAQLFGLQLESADVVVLNKIDALDESDLLAAEQMVRARAPKVRFLELAYEARLDPRLTLGLKLHGVSTASHHHGPLHHAPGPGTAPLMSQDLVNGHSHGGMGSHVHGEDSHAHFHETDPGWQSFVLHSHDRQDPDALPAAVRQVCLDHPVLRVKGFVRTPNSHHQIELQAVRARVDVRPGGHSHSPDSKLVFIGYHPARTEIAAQMSALTHTRWH